MFLHTYLSEILHWVLRKPRDVMATLGFFGHYFPLVNAKPNVKFLRGMHYLKVKQTRTITQPFISKANVENF